MAPAAAARRRKRYPAAPEGRIFAPRRSATAAESWHALLRAWWHMCCADFRLLTSTFLVVAPTMDP